MRMTQLDLTIASSRGRKPARNRWRKRIVLGVALAALAGIAHWQLRSTEEPLLRSIVPDALIEAISLEVRDLQDASRGLTVADYETKRRSMIGSGTERPLGAKPHEKGDEPPAAGTSPSPQKAGAGPSPPIVSR